MHSSLSEGDLLPIAGVKLYSTAAAIKYTDRLDLCLIEVCAGASIAGVFTQNAFCAAPVHVAKAHLKERDLNKKSYLLINAGNANAGTGNQGLLDARKSCCLVAEQLSTEHEIIEECQVFPFSTGVIGETLPMEKLSYAITQIQQQSLKEEKKAWQNASQAILTTDTSPKVLSKTIPLSNGQEINLTGMAKGSGMIKPNMATMLAYIACDAKIGQNLLNAMLREASDQSFNCITIDGDTSTNDAFMLVASGKGANIEENSPDYVVLQKAINNIAIHLAQAIVKDGEGATKFIEININGGYSIEECKSVAYTIAHSPLVKTAFFASDPNWGRILAALGRAPIDGLDIAQVDIDLGEHSLITRGELSSSYTEQLGQEVMDRKDIAIHVNLNRGKHQSKLWTCDFSYDYVKINAEYRS